MPDVPSVGAVTDTALPTPVPPAPTVELRIEANPFGLPPAALFGVARRRNPKRSALFVSRVLGKHIPAPPAVVSFCGLLLGGVVAQALRPGLAATPADPGRLLSDPSGAAAEVAGWRARPLEVGPVVVVGYAETATALGHLVAERLAGARFVHTTRMVEPEHPPVITFSEEHSHATAHRVSHRDPSVFAVADPVVLVDDELTTGRTALNTIRALHARHPRSRYLVASLLDWRDDEAREHFAATESELGVGIEVVSLLAGRVVGGVVDDQILEPDVTAADGASDPGGVVEHRLALPGPTGRHGWDPRHQGRLDEVLEEAASQVVTRLGGERVLVVGTEELMYVPLRLAEHLGPRARFQSTTRSPVVVADVEGYPVRHRHVFTHPGAPDRPSFLYNAPPGTADDLVVVVEAPPGGRHHDADRLLAALAPTASRRHLVLLSPEDAP